MRSRASAVANRGGNTDNDGAADGIGDDNGPPSSPSSSASASLPCPECGQTFRRREHLTDDDVSAALSPPRQHLQPIISQSCVSDQLSLEPDLLWDALLTPAQFLFPFSPVPSLGPGTSTDFCFGDAALAAIGQSADDQSVQNSFGAKATPRVGVEVVEVFNVPDNLTAEEEDILIAEHIPHVPPMTAETRAHMIQAIKARLPQHEAQGLDANFPSLRYLDTYMQLYFEHFHPRMPLLHKPTFQASSEMWQLVLSVVCLGSRYSLAHHHQDHVLLLQRIAQHMLKRDIRELSSHDVLTCAQSLLLFHQSQWLSGEWNIVMEVQFHRNILVTLCRQLLSREGTLMHTHTSAEDANHAWSQWIQAEAKRRIIHFTWRWECLQATFFMLPPLLSIAELQTPVPTADAHWSSSYEQWHLHPPPQPSSTICALIARVGLGDVVPTSLDQPAKSTILLSAIVQQAAESDLLRAMGLGSVGSTASQPGLALGMGTMLSQKAFDALSQVGCSQVLRGTDAGTNSNDFALLSRVLSICSFTPLRLLNSYSKWQTTDAGHSNARSELLDIIPQNVGRARHCLYYAAQVLQYFRTTRVATILDILSVLICVLYMVVYADIFEQDPSSAGSGVSVGTSSTEIIRLDQVVDADLLNGWLEVRNHRRPHITGVGLLHSGRSVPRLYKEASRIMASGSSVSRMAKEMSMILESQGKGYPPELVHRQGG
ncbi:Zinc finger protein zas1 [Colletotrichum fructicola Nara gc5]|uniref:Zinc finger protein zas1 n=1 Tax=Colletotrichum fructicola (strain Nara gc5) TaxID=1213859 RepID=A0A7J6IWJ1_COLFN|nr:Zinc finger protein zas1 [Colletotrichum fructicola]KAF4481267.1 Zinc finger protein zas1 [Colletotrichum fructicola Nara gc5]